MRGDISYEQRGDGAGREYQIELRVIRRAGLSGVKENGEK